MLPTSGRRRIDRGPDDPMPDAMVELAYRTCGDGWQKAVAWRLAGALNESAWRRVRRRRPARLCAQLATLANRIEEAAAVAGEAAGLACAEGLRMLGQPRLVHQIAGTVVGKTVPPVGGELAGEVARELRIIGIWTCVSAGRPLAACRCLTELASKRTREELEEALAQALTPLRSGSVGRSC